MKEILLDEKSIQEINNFLQEMPLKYGLPLLNFFNKKLQEQQPQTQVNQEHIQELSN